MTDDIEFPMEPRVYHEALCRDCKVEFWDGERDQDDVRTAKRKWYVKEDGSVVYLSVCEDGHRDEYVVEPMNGKHRHPGFTGASARHPIDQKHRDEEYRHPIPSEVESCKDATEAGKQ